MVRTRQLMGLSLLTLALALGVYRLNHYQYPKPVDPTAKRWVPTIYANDSHGIVQLLQKYSIQEQDKLGNTPLHYACGSYLKDDKNGILENSNNALKPYERPEVIKLLLTQGANPNTVNKVGWSPLHYCVKHSHLQSVALLLEAQANPNLADNSGVSPLAFAKSKQLVLVEKLLSTKLN